MTTCVTCNIIKGEIIPPKGILYHNKHIVLSHCLDIKVPGYLLLSSKRHVTRFCDLNLNEINSIYSTLSYALSILQDWKDIKKIYQLSFGEECAHFHYHLFPVYGWMYGLSEVKKGTSVDGAYLFSLIRKNCKVMHKNIKENDIVRAASLIKLGFKNIKRKDKL